MSTADAIRQCVWVLIASANMSLAHAAAPQDAGKAVFARVCEMCHGPGGNGAGQGPALVPFSKELSELAGIVRQGVGMMPSIPRSEISDEEIAQVYAYLKSLSANRESPFVGITAAARTR
jgi:mono/diheme cytochrome c family protein